MSLRSRKKVLILITVQFAVRYILRTRLLQSIARFADPIIWITWRDEKLKQELEAAGATVYDMPVASYGRYYNFIRGIIKEKFKRLIKSPSTKIDEKRATLIYGKPMLSTLNRIFLLISMVLSYILPKQVILMIHDRFMKTDTNLSEVETLFRSQKIDVLFSVTPFLREEQVILAACKHLNLKTITSILSFDNITTRGFMPIMFDHYLLWNKYNFDELHRAYPEVKGSTVEIVGPAQFDFYWDKSLLWSKDKWLSELGLPMGRPFILFGGASYSIVPHEQIWLKQLDDAITKGLILENPIILFRKHPIDPIERWLPVLAESKNIIRDDPWKSDDGASKMNITRYDIEKLCSTLKWCDVHINASSTMSIDGAIFDKPQIGPAYDDSGDRKFDAITKELYLREHYKPITDSGGLTIVNSYEELIQTINQCLKNPEAGREQRKKMAQEICYYTDGKSTERLSSLLEKYICAKI
jgi:hypothetical protein